MKVLKMFRRSQSTTSDIQQPNKHAVKIWNIPNLRKDSLNTTRTISCFDMVPLTRFLISQLGRTGFVSTHLRPDTSSVFQVISGLRHPLTYADKDKEGWIRKEDTRKHINFMAFQP
ncbi:hypothetical protein XENOCAPTIV_021841 [Xenoophorus captivus]|uniref:EF-hand domain-containing protein n=1 Tax=Xenoophorus captivus TaxID=1517983 RepID=A0ABV0S8C3_9TELE